jgi:two-component system response regulator CssR
VKVINLKKIFLVEDEKLLVDLLTSYLIEAGYDVKSFNNGIDAKNSILERPDLWALDIMLPGMDGYSLIKQIKSITPDIPVIFMSARNAELDRVVGLEMGSDDYLPKPFLPRELVLRINRILNKDENIQNKSVVQIGPYIFNRARRIISIEDEEITLTVKEYEFLNLLINSHKKAISRTDIIDNLWGSDYIGSERVVDDTLRRIRKKLPNLPLETVYGYGYILKME